jgi:hypothetical protein
MEEGREGLVNTAGDDNMGDGVEEGEEGEEGEHGEEEEEEILEFREIVADDSGEGSSGEDEGLAPDQLEQLLQGRRCLRTQIHCKRLMLLD